MTEEEKKRIDDLAGFGALFLFISWALSVGLAFIVGYSIGTR